MAGNGARRGAGDARRVHLLHSQCERKLAPGRGEVAEWLNAPDSKSDVGVTPPGVQIPPSPPELIWISSVVRYRRPVGRLRLLRAILDCAQFCARPDTKSLDSGGFWGTYPRHSYGN